MKKILGNFLNFNGTFIRKICLELKFKTLNFLKEKIRFFTQQ